MNFKTLIKHSSELLRLVVKSNSPSNKIVSDYLRSKIYIGSRDRKIITEIFYSAYRNLILLNSIINNNLEKKKDELLTISTKQNSDDSLRIILALIILESNKKEFLNYDFKELYKLIPDKTKNEPQEEIESLVAEFFNVETKNSKQIINSIIKQYKLLNEQLTETKNTEHNKENLLKLLSIRYSIDESLTNELINFYRYDTAKNLIASLNNSADLTLRVNSIATTPDDILQTLKSNNIKALRTTYSPSGIKIDGRIQISNYDFFKKGLVEIQDEGSQIISYALGPAENTRILDACAGAGGKTLHLASITNDNSEIIATDIDNRKLKELNKRAKRFGFSSISTISISGKKFTELIAKAQKFIKKDFDYVLVDAPCSGIGTARREPWHKYKLSPKLIKKLQENQLRILSYYSKYVKKGGILVYATCSIMPDENQEVINKFLEYNTNFQPSPLKEAFTRHGIKIPKLSNKAYFINLLPSVHGTDGFFIARMIHE
jgi:16S rRNA (cytosine967-C5)-methyltransferase